MSKTHVIRWKSKINGRAGRGTKHFALGEAETLVQELNQEYPNIHHELLDSDVLNEAESESSADKEQEDAESSNENEKKQTSYQTHAFSE